MMKF
jgi:hypothetical protein